MSFDDKDIKATQDALNLMSEFSNSSSSSSTSSALVSSASQEVKNIQTKSNVFDVYCISQDKSVFENNIITLINDLKSLLNYSSIMTLTKGLADKLDEKSLNDLIQELNKLKNSKSETKQTGQNKYAIFFDFDCTLTFIHMSLFNININEFDKRPHWKNYIVFLEYFDQTKLDHKKLSENKLYFGSTIRFSKLEKMLDGIKKAGFDIYITSRGECGQIKQVLEDAGLDGYFTEINANTTTGKSCVTMAKDKYILSKIKEKKYEVVYYVDDDPKEHNRLISDNLNNLIKLDVAYYYIDNFLNNVKLHKEQNGLTENMMAYILELCKNVGNYKQSLINNMKTLEQQLQQQKLQQQHNDNDGPSGGGVSHLNDYKKYKHQYKQLKKEFYNL